MLKLYYNWRYKRAQRVGSFKLPNRIGSRHIGLGSYLSQDTVRGRHFDRFDLPYKRGRWLKWILRLGLLALAVWLVYESVQAFAIIKN